MALLRPLLRRRARFPLAGQTIVVTGAGSGIGRAFALRMANQGCPLAIVDHDTAALQETADLMADPVLSRMLDVRDRLGQLAFASDVVAWAPAPIGMVFNNAGVWVAQTLAEGSDEDDEWLRAINYGGVVRRRRHSGRRPAR